MRYCPNDDCPFIDNAGQRSTYEDHVEVCVDCGTPLVSGEPPELRPEANAEGRYVVLDTYEPPDAAQVIHLLRAQGIPVFIGDEYFDGKIDVEGEEPIEIQVRPQDLADAKELLAEVLSSMGEVPPEFAADAEPEETCPQCGGHEFERREVAPTGWRAIFSTTRRVRCCTACGTEI